MRSVGNLKEGEVPLKELTRLLPLVENPRGVVAVCFEFGQDKVWVSFY
ncbi:hypothetical protein [Coxiella-like endosymbiont of Rhipicephalus sanguineus]|nr:hypothetical protein [Coxiella-like endosymbiont of Rhipicephalus sanguineus]